MSTARSGTGDEAAPLPQAARHDVTDAQVARQLVRHPAAQLMEVETMGRRPTPPDAELSTPHRDDDWDEGGGTPVGRYLADVSRAVRALDLDQIEAVLDTLLGACRRHRPSRRPGAESTAPR